MQEKPPPGFLHRDRKESAFRRYYRPGRGKKSSLKRVDPLVDLLRVALVAATWRKKGGDRQLK